MKTTTCQEAFTFFSSQKNSKNILLDVRTPAEYRSCHISFSKNIPLDELKNHLEDLKKYEQVFVHCQKGGRGTKACEVLASLGCKNIVNIDGGIEAWEKENLPVVKGKGSISIMRQVQITAGSLILLGAILAHWSFNFLYLSAFVGAGLLFAGLTGTCAMATLLGKMPWNK